MLLEKTQRKESNEMIVELLGDTPDKLAFIMLSNDDTVEPKFKYDDEGNRTDEMVAKAVSLHINGKGLEITVKVSQPDFTLAQNGLAESRPCRPVNLAVALVNGNYYWRCDGILPVTDKKAES